MLQFDPMEIRKAISILKPDGQLFEIRVICEDKKNYSGYFTDADTMISELGKISLNGANVYITLNNIDRACYDRPQKNKFERNAKNTTSDNDIVGYEWLMIDLDPKRPAGTSSTDAQVEKCKALGNNIYTFMLQQGFEKPLLALSGNGAHLLYKVKLNNTSENKKLMENVLNALDILFSSDEIEIDRKVFNPARVCKLYGTIARKGTNSEERPHRISKILNPGQEIKVNDKAYLEKLCKVLPNDKPEAKAYNNYSPTEFRVDEWLLKHGLNFKQTSYSGGIKYILDHCPFDDSHKGKDACIFKSSNGAIGFHCFHNSCADKTWRDVRLLYEPDAYERKYKEYEYRQTHNYNRNTKPEPKHIKQEENKPVFMTARQILDKPETEDTYIKTGIKMLDQKIIGLAKGSVTVISGLRSAAKSTLLSQWALEAIDEGFNVGFCTLELKDKKFLKWMLLQAAGKGYTVQSQNNENFYFVPKKRQEIIVDWIGKRLWVYNNDYGNDFNAIIEQFTKKIDEDKLDIIVLDNLMAFDVKGLSDNKWEAQTTFVLKLADLAKKKNVHIIFVAHPRKAQGFLRLDDISGTGDLSNAVDYAFIVHRNNNDFRRLSGVMFGWKESNQIYDGTNVIEVCKDRDFGTQDFFIPLWFEAESKRLKNEPAESKIYGWMNETSSKEPENKPTTKNETSPEQEYIEPVTDDDFVEMDINMEIPFN